MSGGENKCYRNAEKEEPLHLRVEEEGSTEEREQLQLGFEFEENWKTWGKWRTNTLGSQREWRLPKGRQYKVERRKHLRVVTRRRCFSVSRLPPSVNWGKLLITSSLWFFTYNVMRIVLTFENLSWGINRVTHIKCFVQCLAHSKPSINGTNHLKFWLNCGICLFSWGRWGVSKDFCAEMCKSKAVKSRPWS